MSGEGDFLRALRSMVADPAALGLRDDVAVLPTGGEQLVLTADMLVEGVHYLSDDPAETVGWKLACVNLSDLAAKGAHPRGCLLGYMLAGDAQWDAAFLAGLASALETYGMPLIGGDTVARAPGGGPRALSLTAIGAVAADRAVPSRGGARPGDRLYVTGPVGDAGLGLRLLQAGEAGPAALIEAYRRPRPHLDMGMALAPLAHAMMDVSDGLLIDAARMAEASGCAIHVDHVPLSQALGERSGDTVSVRLAAATAGDDYVLLAALPEAARPPAGAIPVGHCLEGSGLSLALDGRPVALPARLGFEHD